MTVRRLDESGDITTQGTQFLTGVEEIEQTIRTRLRLFLGEYFRDITDGTPWFEQILGKGTPMSAREAALRNRILRTPGVVRLTSFSTDFDIDTRKYTVTAGALTTYGLVTVTENG
ncbi:phospholipase [Phage vB_KsaM-C1]|nr:phospholipase [Phage vB_KsaM-C1]